MQSGMRGRGAVKPRQPRATRACRRSGVRRVTTCTRKPELQRRRTLWYHFTSNFCHYVWTSAADVLSDMGVGRLTARMWTGMTASQRNEKWAELLSNGFWRKLSGKRQEFAIPVLRLRGGLREVLRIRDTVSTCTRVPETYQVDSVLRASECVMSARNQCWDVYKAYLED